MTSTTELLQFVEKLKIKNFNGIFARDDIPKALKKGCYILNYDSERGEGTHWCAIRMETPKTGEYFSSFGDPPLKYFYDKKMKMTYNDVQNQSFESSMCGQFCVIYLLLRQNGASMEDICVKLFRHNNEAERRRNNLLLLRILEVAD
jgi:hypothetical protein